MKLEVDSAKTYTYGDWVQGTISLGSTDSCKGDVKIELRGMIIVTYDRDRDKKVSSHCLYTVGTTVKIPQIGQSSQESANEKMVPFALQFPDRQQGVKIPSTSRDKVPDTRKGLIGTYDSVEFRHKLTIRVDKHKLLRQKIHTSVDIQFKASESVSLLSAPRKVYREHCHKGLSALAEISAPSFFAQGVEHRIFVRLLKPEITGLRLVNARAGLFWSHFSPSLKKRAFTIHIASSGYIPAVEDATSIELAVEIPDGQDRTYQSGGIVCRFYLEVCLIMFNHKTQRCQKLVFREPVDVLPELLYKNKPGCFATPEEVRVLVAQGEGNKGFAAVNCSAKASEVELR